MSDELADQLKAQAAEHERRRLIRAEQQEREREREAWVYSMAAYEYKDLVQFMKDEVEDTRSKTNNSQEFTVAGSSFSSVTSHSTFSSTNRIDECAPFGIMARAAGRKVVSLYSNNMIFLLYLIDINQHYRN